MPSGSVDFQWKMLNLELYTHLVLDQSNLAVQEQIKTFNLFKLIYTCVW